MMIRVSKGHDRSESVVYLFDVPYRWCCRIRQSLRQLCLIPQRMILVSMRRREYVPAAGTLTQATDTWCGPYCRSGLSRAGLLCGPYCPTNY